MKLELDTLKCVIMLREVGFERKKAEGLVEVFSGVDLRNLYSKEETNTMLSEAVQKVFDDNEKRLEAYERRTDAGIAEMKAGIKAETSAIKAEARAGRRWVIGTIITVGLALAGYLSALIHLTH